MVTDAQGAQRWLPSEGETPRGTLERLSRQLRAELGAERVGIWLHDPDAGTVSPYVADPADVPETTARAWQHLPVSTYDLIERVVEKRERVRVDDVTDPVVPDEFRAAFRPGSFLLVPLVAGRTVGFVAVEPAGAGGDHLDEVLAYVAAAAAQAHTWRESQRRRTRAELLLSIIDEAAGLPSVDDVLITACERLAAELRVRRAAVFLLDDDGRLAPRMAGYADRRRDELQLEAFVDPAEPFEFGEWVLQEQGPVVIEDVTEVDAENWWADRFDIASVVGVPIGSAEEAVGVLTLDSGEPRHFTPDQVRLAEVVATHLGTVIDRARIAEDRVEHLRSATTIRRLLEQSATATTVGEAARILGRVTHEALGTDHAVIFHRDADRRVRDLVLIDVPEDEHGLVHEAVERDPDGVSNFLDRVLEPGVRLVQDVREEGPLPDDVPDGRTWARISGIVDALDVCSFVALPVLAPEGPSGVIVCATTARTRRWRDADRRLLEQLAFEGSIVLESAALREEQRERLADLSHRAFHDELTGLPNRALLVDRIDHALARAERHPETVAAVFVDLDRFKIINDTVSHEAGDQVLVEVAERLRDSVRPADTVARLAGDEFVIVFEEIAGRAEAALVADRIETKLREPFEVEGRRFRVSASLGIAVSGGEQIGAEELISRADTAMYRAKTERSGTAFFEEPPDEVTMEAPLSGGDLRAALDGEQFAVEFQPIVGLDSGDIVAVDAVLRWRHPTLGQIPAERFVPLAEDEGMIRELGVWALRAAAREVVSWSRAGVADLAVAVRVAEGQLHTASFVADVGEALVETKLPPERLMLAVPEITALRDPLGVSEHLVALRDLDVRILLDEFGRGHTSLRQIQELPIDVLRIDPSFVDGVATETGDAALVRAILDIGDNLDLAVVAAGIETHQQHDALVRSGCDYGQGELYHRSVNGNRIRAVLTRQKQARTGSLSSGLSTSALRVGST